MELLINPDKAKFKVAPQLDAIEEGVSPVRHIDSEDNLMIDVEPPFGKEPKTALPTPRDSMADDQLDLVK